MNHPSIRSLPRARLAGLTVFAAAALLAGCSSVPLGDTGAPVESRTPGAAGSSGGTGTAGVGAGESRVAPVDLTKGAANDASSLAGRTVYFEFDSFVVKDEYRPLIDRFAKSLAGDRTKRLQVEGHTDDQGGREYNLALGQKRAEAVAKSLALLGASSTQVEAVSFGKERPAATGSDDGARAKNRRAELNAR